jgi:hypothetical protein
MQKLHVGSGTTRGALTVFPVWGEYAGARGYDAGAGAVAVVEQPSGPVVGSLLATNGGPRPVLMLEGQLVQGGWQNRLVARSVLVPPAASMDLDALCVEAGRWGGGRSQGRSERRASLRVRGGAQASSGRQGEVWSRVAEYDARYGVDATSSFLGHLDRAANDVHRLVEGIKPLPGQTGVVVAVAGQPVALEAFDSPRTLAESFASIVAAAAMDAVGQVEVATPSRRARRFVDRAARVCRRPVAPAGLGTTVAGADQYAGVTGLVWRQREVHLLVTNPRHPLMVGAGR